METLLSHSFDYLSSCELHKIRKGLRQVEGLLAQICQKYESPSGDYGTARKLVTFSSVKSLEELCDDPAFLEWFELQENFQWNVTTHLLSCLSHLLALEPNSETDSLILSTLDLVQGCLLLHPSSRTLFAREINMNMLLDLLEPSNCPPVQSASLFTLVSSLLCQPANMRTFEELDGLLTVTSLFKLRATRREVKLRLVEFLYFYLMPENPVDVENEVLGRSSNVSQRSSRAGKSMWPNTKTLDEKRIMLGRYLNNVDDLVADLRETIPFGGGHTSACS